MIEKVVCSYSTCVRGLDATMGGFAVLFCEFFSALCGVSIRWVGSEHRQRRVWRLCRSLLLSIVILQRPETSVAWITERGEVRLPLCSVTVTSLMSNWSSSPCFFLLRLVLDLPNCDTQQLYGHTFFLSFATIPTSRLCMARAWCVTAFPVPRGSTGGRFSRLPSFIACLTTLQCRLGWTMCTAGMEASM